MYIQNITKKITKIYYKQSWALALFSQVHSPLNFYPWFTIALLLILQIFRFAHRSIAPEMTYGSLLEKSTKTIPPPLAKYVLYSESELCVVCERNSQRGGGGMGVLYVHPQHAVEEVEIEKNTNPHCFASSLIKIF